MLLLECRFPTQPLGGGMRESEGVQRQFENRFWMTEWCDLGPALNIGLCGAAVNILVNYRPGLFPRTEHCFDWYVP